MQETKPVLTKAQEEAILKQAAEINNRRFAVEKAKSDLKRKKDEEERKRAIAQKAKEKFDALYAKVKEQYLELTTGYGIFDPREWEIGDEGITGPPEFVVTTEPGQEWNSYREEYMYKGVNLDLDFEAFNKMVKEIGLGQRLKITVELLEPLPPEKFEKLPWVKPYLETRDV
jgi:hypothetical protein